MKRTIAGEAIKAFEVVQAEPEFLAQCQAALAAANRGSEESVHALIDLARIGQAIMADPSRWGPMPTKRRSDSAIDLVATFLGAHRLTLREAMRIVETFTPETLESFLSRHSTTGRALGERWSRVVQQFTAGCSHHDDFALVGLWQDGLVSASPFPTLTCTM
jgi:hypothetical protein